MGDEDRERESGDEEQLGRLLDGHLPALQRFIAKRASGMILAREEAEDLAQSVCRDVIEQVDDGRMELRTEAEFKQWLYEAALLKLKSRMKHHGAQRRDPGREVARLNDSTSTPLGLEPGDSATPSRFALAAEERDRVRRAIEAVGGRDAEVLRLAVLEEKPHREVAAALEIDVAHSRVLLSRAMVKLSKVLGKD